MNIIVVYYKSIFFNISFAILLNVYFVGLEFLWIAPYTGFIYHNHVYIVCTCMPESLPTWSKNCV